MSGTTSVTICPVISGRRQIIIIENGVRSEIVTSVEEAAKLALDVIKKRTHV